MESKKMLMLIRTFAVLAALLLLVSPARAVPPAGELAPDWTEVSPLPVGGGVYAWAQCSGQQDVFYVIGGAVDVSVGINFLQRYDVTSDDWTTLTPLPEVFLGAEAVCYDGHLYVPGGNLSDRFYIYDIAGDSWASGPNLPREVYVAALGTWDGKLYLVGGAATGYPYTPASTVNIYDIAAGTWGTGPSMPVAASGAGYVQMGRYLYVVGGWSGNFNANLNATQRLDMATQEWQLGPSFASRRAIMALPATQDRLYAIGGDANFLGYTNPTAIVEYLDISDWPNGTWITIPDPLPVALGGNSGSFCSEALTGGEIWSVGGFETGIVVTNSVQYRPAEACFTPFYQVSMLPNDSTGENYPGETVTHMLTVDNSGHLEDSYDVAVASTWAASYPSTVGPLKPGETALIVIDVQVPPGEPPGGSDSATVTVSSQGDAGVSDQSTLVTTALSEYGVDVSPESNAKLSPAGETVTYTLQVENIGILADTIDLTVSGNTWPVSLPVTETALAAGASAAIQVEVSIPAGAAEGESDTAILTATSQGDSGQSDSATLMTSVSKHGVGLAPVSLALTVAQGETVTYTLTLTNTGDVSDTIELASSGNEWPLTLPLTETALAAGASMEVNIQVNVPMQALGGSTDTATITAASKAKPAASAASTLTTTALWHRRYLPLIISSQP